MPCGEDVTVPAPVPVLLTCSSTRAWGSKLALTACACDINTVQVDAVPLQAPPHPTNTDPALAEALRVTLVLASNEAEQVAPQLMPTGEDVT